MKRNWKQGVLVATMLVLVGAAAFLNWKYSGNTPQQTGGKILGESTLVSGADSSAAAAAATASGAVDEEAVYTDTGSDYFASARLTRQQARDNAIGLLEQAAAEDGAAQSVANEASEGIQVLASYTMKEAQIENLVTAKGYADCVAFMGDDSVSVVVSTDSGELTDQDVAKIKDITVSETGYPASTVKIMAAN
ncbi:MAG: SpoIIIAH-like family protein [Oscillibacter sp.]|jgi:stage III sporulation protein AH|nr:SpoIIIAH-like family protein [Oscillibacter sp.]